MNDHHAVAVLPAERFGESTIIGSLLCRSRLPGQNSSTSSAEESTRISTNAYEGDSKQADETRN